MVNLVKIVVIVALTLLSITSCSTKPSLQQYFVAHESKDNFTIIDIPKSILGFTEESFSSKQKQAYNSINKVQLLAYPIASGDAAVYDAEKQAVKNLLKASEYTTVGRMSTGGGKVMITYLGEADAIDEMIVFGYKKDVGLGIARILGDGMNTEAIASLYDALKSSNPDDSKIKEYLELFQ